MKKLIINADDFGLNTRINDGIIEAYKSKIVTSVSMIVTEEAGFQHALNLLKTNNIILGIGIHLNLDRYFYINHIKGRALSWIEPRPTIDTILNDVRAQIEKLLNCGIKPDHLSSHHHVHLVPELFPHICEIAKSYGIEAIRFNRKIVNTVSEYETFKKIIEQYSILYVPHYIEGWYFGNIDEPYEVAELVTHPGYGEVWREFELSVCRNQELKGYIHGKGIQLITFQDFINSIKNK